MVLSTDASLGERAKLCGVMWRDLDPQEKSVSGSDF